MSYVEKKYRHIVEDILTKLTGGIVNEEYTFSENQLEFELDEFPVRAIVLVTGVVNGQSYTFSKGSDYQLKSETTLEWIGQKPDIGSTFYVDYYPQSATSPITDRNIGSVSRTITEAVSLELAKVYAQLKYVYLNSFIDTASGESLDLLVAILGIKRYKAGYAIGEVTFSRNTAAPADITIPVGTIVTDKSDPPHEYQTTQEKVLRKGRTSVDIAIRALVEGEIVEAETLTLMPKPVLGIERVSNTEATSVGIQDETDEELRARAKKVVKGTNTATLEALRLSLLGIDFIRSVNIIDQPKGVAGRVDIIVDTDEPFDDIVQNKLMEMINKVKAAGIYVEVGATMKIYPTYTLKLTLVEENPTAEEIEAIQADIKKGVQNYFDTLKPGENVLANKIIAIVMNNEKVKTVKITGVRITKEGEEKIAANVLLNKDIYIGNFEKAAVKEVVEPVDFEEIELPEEVVPPEELRDIYPILADLMICVGLTEKGANMEESRLKAVLTSKAAVFFSDLAAGEKIIFSSLLKELQDTKGRYLIKGEKESYLKLIHTFDGLTVTLDEEFKNDEIRKNEVVELSNVEIRIIQAVAGAENEF